MSRRVARRKLWIKIKKRIAFWKQRTQNHENRRLLHKFSNLTLFSPQTCSDDIEWAGPQHFLQDHVHQATTQISPPKCAGWSKSLLCADSQTAKLSIDERWAHMQSCRKCCASAEISEILLAGFIFIKFLVKPQGVSRQRPTYMRIHS